MVCDMVGASKSYGTSSVWAYYNANKHEWFMHPDSQTRFEELLKLWNVK